MNIVILGPQGSGKTTQAKILAQYLNLPHISTGKLIKSIVDNPNHPLHDEITKQYSSGNLVDDTIVNSILSEAVGEASKNGIGVILDGTPRKHPQVSLLDDLFHKFNKKIDLVVFINTSMKESRKRLLKRAEIEHRPDDTPEAIDRRLKLYVKETIPVLGEYKNRGILKKVDGNPDVETVSNAIRDVVESFENTFR